MKHFLSCLLIIFFASRSISQDFDYYHIGDTNDIQTSPTPGTCLMGGATENNDGATWFLERSDGGNIVVLRASGTDGYNDYFFNQLGVNVQSVETIVFSNSNANSSSFIQRRIQAAEAIWIAGGDQFIYESYWKGTVIEDLLNQHINDKGYPIGGTSAGMAILGSHYFNAENGTITSNLALNDPLNNAVSISSDFLNVPSLENTITDTHYDNPDRKGRHIVFLAHLLEMNGGLNFGIAAEEYVAICIDQNGIATVFGEHPTFEDFAFFIRTNCTETGPSTFSNGSPLEWNPSQDNALQVCKMEATANGNQKFDLNLWKNINGGIWHGWSVDNGTLNISNSSYEPCDLKTDNNKKYPELIVYPQPANDQISLKTELSIKSIAICNNIGEVVVNKEACSKLSVRHISSGIYTLFVDFHNGDQQKVKISVVH